MKQAREALRRMPLRFLRKCEKHYSKKENRRYQDAPSCLFCLEYAYPPIASNTVTCGKCPFNKLITNPNYRGCEHIRYGNFLKFGRRDRDFQFINILGPVGESAGIKFWWRGFLRDLRAVIKEKESK